MGAHLRTVAGSIAAALVAGCAGASADPAVEPPAASDVVRFEVPGRGEFRVEPFEGEPVCDPRALARLVRTMFGRTHTTEGAHPYDALLTLEEFFEGNGDPNSFGSNVGTDAFADPDGWYAAASALRRRPGIVDVFVWNAELELYEDGRIASWPHADSLLVVTALSNRELAELVGHMRPDDVFDDYADAYDRGFRGAGLDPPSAPSRAVQVWWD